MSCLSIELGTGYMCRILSKKPSAFTCKRFAPTKLLRHPLSELLPLQHFEFEPHRRSFHWFVWCHLLKSSEAFMPACSTDQISRLKRIIRTFENYDQKDSAEASVAGSVVTLKAWQQAKAFEAQNLPKWRRICNSLALAFWNFEFANCRRIATLAGCSASQLVFFDNEPGVQGVQDGLVAHSGTDPSYSFIHYLYIIQSPKCLGWPPYNIAFELQEYFITHCIDSFIDVYRMHSCW